MAERQPPAFGRTGSVRAAGHRAAMVGRNHGGFANGLANKPATGQVFPLPGATEFAYGLAFIVGQPGRVGDLGPICLVAKPDRWAVIRAEVVG